MTIEPNPIPANRKWLGLVGWLTLTFGAAATGLFVSVDGWYADLIKPTWNPPAWIFGPVWTLLYILMAIAAWRVWLQGGWKKQGTPLRLFVLQWALNALWTPIFFGLQQPRWAFVDIMLLLGLLVATIRAFRTVDRGAAMLLIPYALWVTFASVLNFAIWRLN